MSATWPTVPLRQVLTERRETPDPESLALGDIGIVSKIGFERGRIELRQELGTNTGMILVRPGDLLISGINAAKGAIAIYGTDNSDPVAATIHYAAYSVVPEHADITYLWWYLRSNPFREILFRSLPEGIKTELKPKRLLPIEIPLPPLAQQRRIVARIETLAAQIAEARDLRQRTAAEVQTFSDKVMTSAFEPFLDRMVPIGNAFRVTTGGTPSRENPAYWNGDVNWVSSGEVAFCRIRETEEKITLLGVENSNAKVYQPSTVLIAMIGQGRTRGQCAILDSPAATNQNVAGIHVYETAHSPEYVYWWLHANYRKSRSVETGTAQPALSGERVKQMLIPLPRLSEQRRIVSELDVLQGEVDGLKRLQAETAAELGALLPSVLDRAFKGEL